MLARRKSGTLYKYNEAIGKIVYFTIFADGLGTS